MYSMIRSCAKFEYNIDIHDFPKLLSLVKGKNVGYKPNKAETFKGSDLSKFLIEAPEKEYLFMKVCV